MSTEIKPSTRALDCLPRPARMRSLLRSLAVLDLILEPDWENRYYSFHPDWASGEQLGLMRNGEGDWAFAWFPGGGRAVLRGYAHESLMSPFRQPGDRSWPGIYEGLPDSLSDARTMGGVLPEEVTFCVWWTGGRWTLGAVAFPDGEVDPDGSERLLELMDDDPTSYVKFAHEYYGGQLPLDFVRRIYRGDPLTKQIIHALNPGADATTVLQEAKEIGYPMTTKKAAKNPGPVGKTDPGSESRKISAAESEAAPVVPKAAATKGHADFLVEVRGPTVRMLVNGKAAAEYTGDGFTLYNELFDLVKTTIKQRKRSQGGGA
jgi:hypothetical protein